MQLTFTNITKITGSAILLILLLIPFLTSKSSSENGWTSTTTTPPATSTITITLNQADLETAITALQSGSGKGPGSGRDDQLRVALRIMTKILATVEAFAAMNPGKIPCLTPQQTDFYQKIKPYAGHYPGDLGRQLTDKITSITQLLNCGKAKGG